MSFLPTAFWIKNSETQSFPELWKQGVSTRGISRCGSQDSWEICQEKICFCEKYGLHWCLCLSLKIMLSIWSPSRVSETNSWIEAKLIGWPNMSKFSIWLLWFPNLEIFVFHLEVKLHKRVSQEHIHAFLKEYKIYELVRKATCTLNESSFFFFEACKESRKIQSLLKQVDATNQQKDCCYNQFYELLNVYRLSADHWLCYIILKLWLSKILCPNNYLREQI